MRGIAHLFLIVLVTIMIPSCDGTAVAKDTSLAGNTAASSPSCYRKSADCSPKELVDEIQKSVNVLALKEKYFNKYFEIQGKVMSVEPIQDPELGECIYVFLDSGHRIPLGFVPCTVVWTCLFPPSSGRELAKLREEDHIEIKGKWINWLKCQGELCFRCVFDDCQITGVVK